MLRRPKPTDSEADLLREQEQFLISGAPSAASVVRRPDKRRGEAGGEGGEQNREDEGSQRDVVTIEGKDVFCLVVVFIMWNICCLTVHILVVFLGSTLKHLHMSYVKSDNNLEPYISKIT